SWSSYYGGPGDDLPGGIAVAGDRIYVTGNTTSSSGIATANAHLDQLNVEFAVDGFLVRFTQGAGHTCAGPEDCLGGQCVDGVCCDSPCDGACDVCSAALGARADGTCTPLAADVVCRPASGACDAAELCPGDAASCPEDAAVPDGEPCDDGMCMAGACEPSPGSTSTDAGTSTSGTSSGGGPGPGDSTVTPTGEAPTTGGGDSNGSGGSEGSSGSTTGDPGGSGDGGCQCRTPGGPGLPGLEGLLVLAALRRRRRVV
ncbi:MAG TPA: MYXO-CTERM sorting domain-containing protein, partial [Nannocystis sp.]